MTESRRDFVHNHSEEASIPSTTHCRTQAATNGPMDERNFSLYIEDGIDNGNLSKRLVNLDMAVKSNQIRGNSVPHSLPEGGTHVPSQRRVHSVRSTPVRFPKYIATGIACVTQ